jgi:hypothetical protein
MTTADRQVVATVTPLLFGKRKPATSAVARQYAGTNTELDNKIPSPTTLH